MNTSKISRHSRAAKVGAAVRRRMADEKWEWRYESTPAKDEHDACAMAMLRRDAERARRWLEHWSAAIGMPLPAGNGVNGPWHRTAILDAAGYVGLLDIAAGRVAWTDCTAPSFVRRFAVEAERAISPNQAGGNGALGAGVTQIALTYHMHPRIDVIVSLPNPRVIWVEYGLTTCYGDIAAAPSADEYRAEWAALVTAGVECRATTARQWERVQTRYSCSVAVAKAVATAYPLGYSSGQSRIEVREGGVHHAGCVGDAEWRVYGTPEERAAVIPRLLRVHEAVAQAHVERVTLEARCAAGLASRGDLDRVGDPLKHQDFLIRLGRRALQEAASS